MKGVAFNLPTFLTVMSTLGLFFFIVLLIFHAVPEETRTPVFALVAVVSNAWSVIVGYHFGSSSGSAAKSKAIETMVADNKSKEDQPK